jgi:hypothetical protein
MQFKALRIPSLTQDTVSKLEALLSNLTGVERFDIALDTQELSIVFDEEQLSFRHLVKTLSEAGCSLHHIDAALLW